MLSALPLLADHGSGRYGDHDGGGFFFLLFLLLVGLGIFFVIRAVRRRRGTWPDREFGGGAKRVLDERFARGEIDRAEYEHRKAVLDGAEVVPPAPAPTGPTPPPPGTATATMTAPAPSEPSDAAAVDDAPDVASDEAAADEPAADGIDDDQPER